MIIPQRIVAEISVNWHEERGNGPISKPFEKIIKFNRKRGYKLEDWKFSQVLDHTRGVINETIIAVFVK